MTEAPPPYSTGPKAQVVSHPTEASMLSDDQLWCLRGYDIVYIVDDSTSMSWTEKRSGIVPWPHARDALMTFSSICEEWDEDGQDLWFLNRAEPLLHATPRQIEEAFNSNSPRGGTNMGRKLLQVISTYFKDYTPSSKPLNIVAITDGQFSDDVTSTIKWIDKELDKRNALPNQIGIQFVQIGADPQAEKCLRMLDDDLQNMGLTRDLVDTVPWIADKADGKNFDGKYLIKVVCGAINKRLDNDNVGRKTKPPVKKSKFRRLFGRMD